MFIDLNGTRIRVGDDGELTDPAECQAWIAAKCAELGCENPNAEAARSTAADRADAARATPASPSPTDHA